MATRVMHDKEDLEGQVINGLHVDRMVSRNPLIWLTTCQKCRAQSNKGHESLQRGTARCFASACGRPQIETASDFRRKEKADADRAVTKRKAIQDELAAASAARLKKAEQQLNETTNKIAKTLAERLQTIPDSELYLSPDDVGVSCGAAEARERNTREANRFIEENPDFYPCAVNHKNLGAYLELNGVKLASRGTLAAAVARLREAGLIQNAPVPVRTAPIAQAAPAEPEHQREHYEPVSSPQEYDGYDLTSGRPRRYSEQELAYLSADEYRRAFKIPTAPIQRLAW